LSPLVALAAGAALVSIFVLAHDQPTRDRFLGPPATIDLLTVYWLVYCSYVGTVGIGQHCCFGATCHVPHRVCFGDERDTAKRGRRTRKLLISCR
jgi:hypothetical protein